MIRLQTRLLFGFLADPFGRCAQALELDGDQIRIAHWGGNLTSTSLQSLVKEPLICKGMLGATLTITLEKHGDVALKGASYPAASKFAEEVKEAWTHFNFAALEKEALRLETILTGLLLGEEVAGTMVAATMLTVLCVAGAKRLA